MNIDEGIKWGFDAQKFDRQCKIKVRDVEFFDFRFVSDSRKAVNFKSIGINKRYGG